MGNALIRSKPDSIRLDPSSRRTIYPGGFFSAQRLQFRRPVGRVGRVAGTLARDCRWALTSINRRLALSPSGLALLLDRDHLRRLRPERGHRAGEVEDVAFTADAKNHPRMFCGHRFWLRALRRVWKGSEFRWHGTQLYLYWGSRSCQRNRKPGVEFHDRNHSASFVALSARVLIDGVLLAPAPRSASLPHCGSATRYVGATDERQSARLWGMHGLLLRALPPPPREGRTQPGRRCS